MTTSQVLSMLRHAPDRWLHAQRHARAIALVPALGVGDRVLVVCYGNVCRSPFAAAVLRRVLAPKGVIVESAGFVGAGRAVPPPALRTARELGVDLTAHRSQLLTETMVRTARLIIVMDLAQRRRLQRHGSGSVVPLLLGDLDPLPIDKRAVRDPWGQSLPVFADVFARIERSSAVLGLAIDAATRGAPNNGAYRSA